MGTIETGYTAIGKKENIRGQSFLSPDTQLECFKGCEIFNVKFKGSENNLENFKGAKFPVPEGIRGMTFSSAREKKV